MAKSDKPELPDIHSDQFIGQVEKVIRFLLESCDPNMSEYQRTKYVTAKLEKLAHIFQRNMSKCKVVDIYPYGFICRMLAMQREYLENLSGKKELSPGAEKAPHEFSREAKMLIDWLSDISNDHIPSEELLDIAKEIFQNQDSLAVTRKALGEIFEKVGDGTVALKEEALCTIMEKIIEKLSKKIPEESRKAVESILESSQPFSDVSMKEAFLRDGGGSIKKHPNGRITPSVNALKHILAGFSLQRLSSKK